jgi:hypothetical protein
LKVEREISSFLYKPAFPKLVAYEKVFEVCFFNYINIKNHKKWESEKAKQN